MKITLLLIAYCFLPIDKKTADQKDQRFNLVSFCTSLPRFYSISGNGKQTEKFFYTEFFISGWRYRMTILYPATLIQKYKRTIKLQSNLFLNHQFPKINKTITHPSQGCINAAVGNRGNFLKAHIGIVTQYDHFPLIFRKTLEHFTDTVMTLPFHHGCFC